MKKGTALKWWMIVIIGAFLLKQFLTTDMKFSKNAESIIGTVSDNKTFKEVIDSLEVGRQEREKREKEDIKQKLQIKILDEKGNVKSDANDFIMKKLAEYAVDFYYSPLGQKIVEKTILTAPDEDGSLSVLEFNNWQDGLYHNSTTTVVAVGKGRDISCGQKIKINYQISDITGVNSFENKNNLSLRLGEKSIIPGLEYLLMNMKVGGVRTAMVPPKLAYGFKSPFFDDKYAKIVFLARVELLDAEKNNTNLDGFTVVSKKYTGQDFLRCGDKFKFTYQIYNGLKPVSPEIVSKETFLGDSNLPIAINIGLDGISSGEERIISLTKASLKSFTGKNTNFLDQRVLSLQNPILKIVSVTKLDPADDVEPSYE